MRQNVKGREIEGTLYNNMGRGDVARMQIQRSQPRYFRYITENVLQHFMCSRQCLRSIVGDLGVCVRLCV